jgi:hypothetical protein
MNPRPQRVAVVLDPEFGDKLMELATSVHVWAVDSQANKAAADRYVRGLKDRNPCEGEIKLTLTIFSREELDSGFLETLEDHHGEYAQDPPWSEIEVFGGSLVKSTQELLEEWGFRDFEQTHQGFLAKK